MSDHHQVLFLCTGNSCRSQIAEALVNHLAVDLWRASSAGTRPDGEVHPLALKVLSEIGVETAELRSKAVDEFAGQSFDLVVTVCDHAAQNCPVWLGEGQVVHWPFPDPAEAEGSAAERMTVFRELRDRMRNEVLTGLSAFSGRV